MILNIDVNNKLFHEYRNRWMREPLLDSGPWSLFCTFNKVPIYALPYVEKRILNDYNINCNVYTGIECFEVEAFNDDDYIKLMAIFGA